MNNRVCRVQMEIGDKRYSLSPLSAEELVSFVAGYRIVNRSEESSPVYLVRVNAKGEVSCNCPAYNFDLRKGQSPKAPPDQPPASCKHCEAMVAAGLLPVKWVELIRERTKLLDIAEQKVKNRDLEREAAIRNTDSLRKTIASLESERNELYHRALQLQQALAVETATPKKRTRRTKVAA